MKKQYQWTRMWRMISICIGMIIGLLLVACQPLQPPAAGESTAQIPEVMIEVSESGFVVDDEIPGGIVRIAIQNVGSAPNAPQLWRIREGHTRDEIVEMKDYIKENPDDFLGMFDLGSWIHMVDESLLAPGDTYRFYADLGTGDFVIFDDRNPDVLAFFSAPELVGTTEPEAAVQLELVDYSYIMPDTISAGKHLWEISNSGEQWHLAAIASYNPDASNGELLASFGGPDSPPPPDAAVEIFGGMPPMSEGERVWLEFELEPGIYELLCPLPDLSALVRGGKPLPHLLHGMRHVFTVIDDAAVMSHSAP